MIQFERRESWHLFFYIISKPLAIKKVTSLDHEIPPNLDYEYIAAKIIYRVYRFLFQTRMRKCAVEKFHFVDNLLNVCNSVIIILYELLTRCATQWIMILIIFFFGIHEDDSIRHLPEMSCAM